MKQQKRKKLIFKFLVIILVLCSFNGIRKIKLVKVENVFDEMYYSVTSNRFESFIRGIPYEGNFHYMPQIRYEEWYHTNNVFMFYKQSHLDENESLWIMYIPDSEYSEKKYLSFTLYYYYHDENGEPLPPSDTFYYKYYPEDKLLVYENNDPKNPEREQFLYDLVLKDYFEALGKRSDYSMDDLGEFTFINAMLEGNEDYQTLYRRKNKTEENSVEE